MNAQQPIDRDWRAWGAGEWSLFTTVTLRLPRLPAIFLLLMLLSVMDSAIAHSDGLSSDLIVRHWKVEDGLPTNSVTGIVQDTDGYLWMSTLAGLVRFDGVQFVSFEPSDANWSASNRLITIRRTPDDVLWLTTERRDLIRFHNGVFTHIKTDDGLPDDEVVRLAQSPEGWLAYGALNGVALITGAGIRQLELPFALGETRGLHWPSDDRLWIATVDELIRVDNPLSNPLATRWPIHLTVRSMAEYAGALWVGGDDGVFKLTPSGLNRQHAQSIVGRVTRMAVTPADGLLVHASAIWRVEQDQATWLSETEPTVKTATLYAPADGGRLFINSGHALRRNGQNMLPLQHGIRGLFRDREGALWLVSDGDGLYQIIETSLETFSSADGLPGDNAYPVLQASDGSIWTGLLGVGLVRIDTVPEHTAEMMDRMDPVWSLAEIDGEIWFAGQGVCRWNGSSECDEVPAAVNESSPFRLIYQDQSGRIWLAGRLGEMWRREQGQWRLLGEQDGWVGRTEVRGVLEFDNGDLWFATNGQGVIRVTPQGSTVFDVNAGLSSNFIRALVAVDDQRLLVGSEDRGLCLIDPVAALEVSIRCLDETDGLMTEGGFHHFIIDDARRLWWNSNRGIFWQPLDDVLAVIAGQMQSLGPGGHYDDRNGMLNAEGNGGVYPAGAVDDAGQFWFPTQAGLVIVDPRAAEQMQAVPPAHALIERVQFDNREIRETSGDIRLPHGQRNLSLDMTALSFFDPDRIEFRYRIPAFSNRWVDIGNSRRLNLTELPPGRFTVEVAARNYMGDWQQDPTRLSLDVAAYWYEEHTARLWALLLFFVALGIAVRWWNRHLIQRANLLQREVDERTEQLQQIFSRRSEFFANLSHELRTPLTLLLGPLSDALADQSALSKNDMQVMLRSASRMKRMVDQMLDLQKIDAGQMQLKREPTELGGFIRSSIEPFELLARQSGVRVELVACDEKLSVELDRLQFEKVLLNLLSNAFKVSPPDSLIEMRLSRQGELALIEVLDCGPGIPEGANERIFNRFHQEPGSYATQSQGTGIGLALVRELMELHGGRVMAANRSEGGARFGCYLPLLQAPAADIADSASAPQVELEAAPPLERSASTVDVDWSIDSNRLTILIVEDNHELRRYIREILEPHYQVIQAVDGAAGIEAARQYLPDLILSDVMMPKMDGFDMARVLRGDAETECIPLLYLTARGSEHDEIEGLSIGADDYLTKPFSRSVLLARVRSIFETRRRLADLNALRAVPLEQASPQSAERADLLSRSRQVIEAHLEDAQFGVEALAAALHMSRSQLFRKLKTEHGLLARDLIREVRLDKAAVLLRTTDASVTEVTYAVGFPSLANFSRAFRERYQVPPSKYRESC